jgi:hypothetical protein
VTLKGVLIVSESLTEAEIADLAAQLQGLKGQIESGEMTASIATRYRLEGAVVGLNAALGQIEDVLDRLFA